MLRAATQRLPRRVVADGGHLCEAAGGSQGGGATGGVGGGSCSAGIYVICEDFESIGVGDVPAGWTRHGDAVGVVDDEAHTGKRALKLDAIPVWERRIWIDDIAFGNERIGCGE